MTDQTKTCTGCGYSKPLADFYPRTSSPDSLTARCKPCLRTARREHYAANAEEINADARANYAAGHRASAEHAARVHAETLATATRHGQPWTAEELAAVADRTRTAREVAVQIGRTAGAVHGMRWRMRGAT